MTPHWAVNYDISYPQWVNKIDTVGCGIGWLYSIRDKLGDILLVLTIQNIMSMTDTKILHIFMIGEQIGHRQTDHHLRWVSYSKGKLRIC